MTHPRHFNEIQRADFALADKIKEQDYFILDEDVAGLIEVNRLMQVLVRCGAGRFICAIDCLNHFLTIIKEHAKLTEILSYDDAPHENSDYVRDVGLIAQ